MNQAPAQLHSDTSIEAARAIQPHMSRLRAMVFAYFSTRGKIGATDEEVQQELHMPANTERPRRIELERMGLIVDSGEKRKTRAGRNASVWVVA